ncbi:hypothetical protein IMCC1909_15330 [Rhodobacteraceae bacterium IMCC1909]|nr:hypothetical protein [Rhodobacteraceae bacterium LE17]MDP4071048.1 hypothetical protein [Rhodobacteraceae bacterium IMCC1909]
MNPIEVNRLPHTRVQMSDLLCYFVADGGTCNGIL